MSQARAIDRSQATEPVKETSPDLNWPRQKPPPRPVHGWKPAEEQASETSGDARFQHDFSDVPVVRPGKGNGRSLPARIRADLEPRFGQDFGRVRIHTDAGAARQAEGLQAKAFTRGRDIYFGRNHYRPERQEGRALLAHELAHTVQQGEAATGPIQPKSQTAPPGHPLEREAEEAARQVTGPRPGNPPRLTPLATGFRPLVLRQATTTEQQTQIQREGGPTPGLEAVVRQVQSALQEDPQDRSGEVRRRLAPFDPLTRQLILARARASIAPGVRQAVEAETEDEEEQPAEQTQRPGRAEGRPAAGEEEATPEQRRRVEAVAGSQEAATESRRREAEAQAGQQAERAAEVPQAADLPDPAASAEAVQERLVESGQQAEAGSRAVGEEAEQAPEAAAEAGQEATEAAAEEAVAEGGATSLRALLDAPPEISSEPSQEDLAATEAYDQAAAQATAQAASAEIQAAAAATAQQMNAQTAATRSQITAAAETTRASVQAQITAQQAALETAFATKSGELTEAIQTLRQTLEGEYEARRNEVSTGGEGSKTTLATKFSDHRTNVNNTVNGKIEAANSLTERRVQAVQSRTARQASEARRRGRTKASSYPNTERGRVQKNAVIGVANRTAAEMEQRQPETVEAIREITEDIPGDFRDKGAEALEGFDRGLPDLQAQVDRHMTTIQGNLDSGMNQARTALDRLESSVSAQLASSRAAASTQIAALGPQANAQIDAGLQSALAPLDSAPQQAVAQINQVAEEAVLILGETDTPDPEAVEQIRAQVIEFISGAAGDAAASLQQAGSQIGAQFAEVEQTVASGLQAMQQQVDTSLQTLSDTTNGKLTETESQVNDNFNGTMDSLSTALGNAETEVDTTLSQALADLIAELDTPLREAEAEIINAENEGLAKNDEALADLEGSMNEAASDAAWDYDHPILSAIGDIAAFVAGAIIAIVAVLVMVVVVILLFKALVAGLVALGISLAVAKLIVAVIGLGLLAYGIYSAYQETGSLGGAILQLTGLSDIARAFTDPNLSPFEAGLSFGKGVGTLATFFIGRGMGRSVNARFARISRLPNPASRTGRFLRFVENPRALRGQQPARALPAGAAPTRQLPAGSPAAPSPRPQATAPAPRRQPAAPAPQARPQPVAQRVQPQQPTATPQTRPQTPATSPQARPQTPAGTPRPRPPQPTTATQSRTQQPTATPRTQPQQPAATGPKRPALRSIEGGGRTTPPRAQRLGSEQTPGGPVQRIGPRPQTTGPAPASQRQAVPVRQAAGAEGYTPQPLQQAPTPTGAGRGGLRVVASSRGTGGRPPAGGTAQPAAPSVSRPAAGAPGGSPLRRPHPPSGRSGSSGRQPDQGLASRGRRPAPGTRTTTREQYRAQESQRRWNERVEQMADEAGQRLDEMAQRASGETSGSRVFRRFQPSDVHRMEQIVRRSMREVRFRMDQQGLGYVPPREYGTRLSATVARRMRSQLPSDWQVSAETPIRNIPGVRGRNLNQTVDQFLTQHPEYNSIRSRLPSEVLGRRLGNLEPDLFVRGPSRELVIWDLTSRESASHLAKTMLYSYILAEEGVLVRIGESFWRNIVP